MFSVCDYSFNSHSDERYMVLLKLSYATHNICLIGILGFREIPVCFVGNYKTIFTASVKLHWLRLTLKLPNAPKAK